MRRIIQAVSAADIEVARGLFVECAESLGIDLGFQDFARELASLPGEYSPSCGSLRSRSTEMPRRGASL
jgi:putative acetyltransferase